ncbi:MAG TPA: hypothetical protein GXX75_22850 [Clostridiales bacterium]|nr:hypothetical protein [Clostridiales bacterium]
MNELEFERYQPEIVPDFHESNEAMEVKEWNEAEGFNMQPDVRHDIPGVEPAFVYGNAYEVADSLDDNQGDNSYNAEGNCGLVSTSNVLTLCGIEADEERITGEAIENQLCNYSPFLPPESRGGVNDTQIIELFKLNGVEATAFPAKSEEGSCEAVARYVEEGHGVAIGINAGYAWQSLAGVNDGSANHEITVTGTVRDEAGRLQGFIVCDSGLIGEDSSARFMSLETMEDAYEDVPGASAVVTNEALRAC